MLKIVMPTVSIAVLCGLTGCSTYNAMQGYPATGCDVGSQIKQLSAYVDKQTTVIETLNTPALRDDYIAHRIALIDLEYNRFLQTISGVKNGMDAGKEIAVGTMGAVGGLIGGGTAQTLSAATAATTAANGGINTVYFYNQTLPAIISAMNSGREAAYTTIVQHQAQKDYTIQQAVVDLTNYYYAGTFAGAAASIQKNSSQSSANSDATQKAVASGKAKLAADPTGATLLPLEKAALLR